MEKEKIIGPSIPLVRVSILYGLILDVPTEYH